MRPRIPHAFTFTTGFDMLVKVIEKKYVAPSPYPDVLKVLHRLRGWEQQEPFPVTGLQMVDCLCVFFQYQACHNQNVVP